MRKFVASFVLGMAVVCFSTVASVAKADYLAMHELSVGSASSNFDFDTNTFWVSEDTKEFFFTIGYQFSNLGEENAGPKNTQFPLLINYDKDIFHATSIALYQSGLNFGSVMEMDYGFLASWSSLMGNLFNGQASLLSVTLTLNDDVLLEDIFSTAITLSLRNGYPNENIFGFDALTIRFSDGSTNPAPEPGTLAVLGLGFAGLAVVRRRRK